MKFEKFQLKIRGHDKKGFMIENRETLEIVSFHKNKEMGERKLKKLRGY